MGRKPVPLFISFFAHHDVEAIEAIGTTVCDDGPGLDFATFWQEADDRGHSATLDTIDLGWRCHESEVSPRPAVIRKSF